MPPMPWWVSVLPAVRVLSRPTNGQVLSRPGQCSSGHHRPHWLFRPGKGHPLVLLTADTCRQEPLHNQLFWPLLSWRTCRAPSGGAFSQPERAKNVQSRIWPNLAGFGGIVRDSAGQSCRIVRECAGLCGIVRNLYDHRKKVGKMCLIYLVEKKL